MPKNIKIVPSRGSEPSKQPYIYFIDSSDQTTEAKVGSGATLTFSASGVATVIELKPRGGVVNVNNPVNIKDFASAGGVQFADATANWVGPTSNLKGAQGFQGPTGVVADGGDTGGTSAATVLPQSAQLFGSSNNASTMSAGGDSSDSGNMTVTAIVSETQITNVQNKINLINKNAEL